MTATKNKKRKEYEGKEQFEGVTSKVKRLKKN